MPNHAEIAATLAATFPGLDAALAELTAWRSARQMLAAVTASTGSPNTYRPTCRLDLDPRFGMIADAFDTAMQILGDERRAYRVEPKGARTGCPA